MLLIIIHRALFIQHYLFSNINVYPAISENFIHTVSNANMEFQGIGVMYILCSRKTKILYNGIWQKIFELAPDFRNNVKLIHGDFEQAAITSYKLSFDTERMGYVGCWYHFNNVSITAF